MRSWYPGERQLYNVLLRMPYIRWRVLMRMVRKGWIVKGSAPTSSEQPSK